jgi:putative resolvase
MSTMQGRLLKIREAAVLLNVSRQSLWKWIKQGKIEAVKLPSGRYRIPESEVVRIMQSAKMGGD